MRTFWFYQTPLFSIKRKSEMIDEDHEEQAKILCMALTSAVPSGTVRKFCQMIGGDYDKVNDIGNKYIKNHKKEYMKRHRMRKFPAPERNTARQIVSEMPKEVLNAIKNSPLTYKNIADTFNVELKVVQFIRCPSRQ